jgi:AcrR family transcriptional regulator
MPGPRELTLLPERTSLPRGVGALSEAEVVASQRGRILQAIVEQVAEGGYHATSVQDVIGRARVSRSAFYGAFGDKEDAFAAAHLLASEQLFDLITAAVRAAPADWRSRLRAGVAAYLQGFVSAPAYAASFMVEIRAAGPRLLDQRDAVLQRHAGRLARVARAAHREQPARPLLSRRAIIGLTGGVDELATREIRAGRIAGLLDLVDPIMELHLAALR